MPNVKGKTQISVHLPNELLEDVRIIARRRGQSLTKFVEFALTEEVENETDQQVKES